MKQKWLKLAGEMLELASNEFSDHVCSDWDWPKDWTEEEKREFSEALVRDNIRTPNGELSQNFLDEISKLCSSSSGPPNWWVMMFLAGQLMKE